MRRRRHYDATGARQRESLMEAADLLREHGADLAAARARAPRRARPHRAPDRGDAPLRARPPAATSRGCSTRSTTRASAARAGARCSTSCARSLTLWWQTDEVRRVRPMVEDEVRRNLFFFEATLLRRGARRSSTSSSAASRCRVDGRELAFGSWAGSDMDGHPGGRRRDARAHARAAPPSGAAAAARPRRRALARRFSHSEPARAGLPRARGVAGARRRRAALRRACCAAPTASGSRCARSSASSPTGSPTCSTAGARAGLRRPAGAARRPLARAASSLGSEHVAHGAIRRLLRQVDVFGFHVASLDVRQSAAVVQEAVAALLPGYAAAPTRRSARRAAGRGDRRGPPRPGAAGPRAGGRAAARARRRRAGARGLRPARRAGDGRSRWREGRPTCSAALWLARARGRASCGSSRCSRRSPTSSARPRRWPRSTRPRVYRDALRGHGDRQIDHARLLGLRQGLGLRREPVGAARGAGAARRAGRRGRARARAVPRPRRVDRRAAAADAPRDPRPAARARCTGASGSPSRARRSPPATATRSSPCARSSRRCPRCCWPRRASSRPCRTRGAPRWSGCASARARGTAALVYEDPDFPRFFTRSRRSPSCRR